MISNILRNRLNHDFLRDRLVTCHRMIAALFFEIARVIKAMAGRLAGLKLRPHDLRRHPTAYAFRTSVPIENVSKVIRRHANLSTTQRYLGTVRDVEAIRWIGNIWVGRRGGLVDRVHPIEDGLGMVTSKIRRLDSCKTIAGNTIIGFLRISWSNLISANLAVKTGSWLGLD